MHDQHARSADPVLGRLDRRAGRRADVLERELRELLCELRLDDVRDQARVAHVARADDGEGRRGVGARAAGDERTGDTPSRGARRALPLDAPVRSAPTVLVTGSETSNPLTSRALLIPPCSLL